MKKIATTLLVISSFSLTAQASSIDNSDKYAFCNGYQHPQTSVVFGEISSSIDPESATLNAAINHIQLRQDAKQMANESHTNLKGFLDQMQKQRSQYTAIGNSRYKNDRTTFDTTIANMNTVTQEQKNSVRNEIYGYLSSQTYVFDGELKPIRINGVDALNMCKEFWR